MNEDTDSLAESAFVLENYLAAPPASWKILIDRAAKRPEGSDERAADLRCARAIRKMEEAIERAETFRKFGL